MPFMILISLATFIGGCTLQKHADIPPVPAQNLQTDFATTRTFNASPERIWQAWTDGEQLKRWWGPRGFTCPVADMDVRIGGTSLVAMKAPPKFGGCTFYNTWTYSTVVPTRRLDFIVRFTDETGKAHHPSELGLPPGIPAEVPHVLIFEPTDDGGTRLIIIEYGYESQDAINLSRQGLEQCLDKLAEEIAP
ncbi:MAG TPA: SRPBCC domain-containing protein [Phycisphaerales bacterium]|nr:SRPBCC domain-containing protein [Phycisphaerales bacterium]HRQ74703.1 SRPBCC domain-containing protein [Phycisphaerales bacterium]